MGRPDQWLSMEELEEIEHPYNEDVKVVVVEAIGEQAAAVMTSDSHRDR